MQDNGKLYRDSLNSLHRFATEILNGIKTVATEFSNIKKNQQDMGAEFNQQAQHIQTLQNKIEVMNASYTQRIEQINLEHTIALDNGAGEDKNVKSSNSSFCFSPELLSPSETFELIMEVIRKAQTSEEMLERLCNNNEFVNFVHNVGIYTNRTRSTNNNNYNRMKDNHNWFIQYSLSLNLIV